VDDSRVTRTMCRLDSLQVARSRTGFSAIAKKLGQLGSRLGGSRK
jgi:hypothetical protein